MRARTSYSIMVCSLLARWTSRHGRTRDDQPALSQAGVPMEDPGGGEVRNAKWLLETRLLAEHGVSTKEGSGKPGGGYKQRKVGTPEVGPKISSQKWSYFLTLRNS